MKKQKFLMSVTLALILGFSAQATSWTVSNDPGRPAQFTTITDAIDAAAPSDTLLITGGTYGETLYLVKDLVLYGESIEGSEFPVTTITGTVNFNRFNSSLSSSGSRIYGIQLNAGVTFNGAFTGAGTGQRHLSDIIIERCRFQGTTYFYQYDGLSNITVRNCLLRNCNWHFNQTLSSPVTLSGFIMTNCIIENSLLSNYSSTCCSSGYDGAIVLRNNVFMDRTSDCFRGLIEIVLENNIFYKAEPTGLSLSTFNNNLTYLCNNNTVPYGDNLGSGNIENSDPLFTNYPALGSDHSWDWDYSLLVGSPAFEAGTSGTDIGLTGGNAPVDNLPRYAKIPGVTVLDIPVSSVPVGGTLQIQIEAVSRD